MKRLIDKAALVAEIKRLIDCCYKICAGNLDFLQKSYPEHYYSIETYKEILSFINTLEVKEVDLNEEIKSYFKGFGKFASVGIDDCIDIAKHFFELGLKASNPITAADRGTAEEIIINLKRIEKDYRIDLTREIEWLRNKVKKGE